MCGIVAILSNTNSVSKCNVERAVFALAPRGPDEQHQWVREDGKVGLGHARLSIIDSVTGSQPISNENSKFRIIVNGEFYDFERIRSELEGRGHRFRTRSDSEIALHLYEDFGAECLEHLRGEFAFAIWDETRETLFAARDRFGIKPLFYFHDGDTLILASEAKAIFATGIRAEWDHESVFQNLFFTFDQDRSLFKNIRQVPPGHYLTASRGEVKIRRYWDVNYPKEKNQTHFDSDKECIKHVRDHLEEAVRLRMRADVPVGCYLSGGVDSSSVLGLARRHAKGRVTAFTIAFDHQDYNEEASARRTAEFAGADFHPVKVTAADFADVFVEAVGRGEMVHYNAHGAARFLLSRAVHNEGYKVVIGGEGADELFAGYDFSSQAVLAAGTGNGMSKLTKTLMRLIRPKSETERRLAAVSPWLARICKGLAFPAHLTDYMADKFEFVESILADDYERKFRNRDPFREFFRQFDWRNSLYKREKAKVILYLWMKSLFVNYVLAAERLDMAHAVEVRLPFLDHKLFEFARSIPVPVLARNGRIKHILREAVKPFVTDEVYDAAKQPFLAPPTVMKAGNPMYELLQDSLRSKSFASVPFFRQSEVIKFLDELPNMEVEQRASMDPILFVMASVAILHDRYDL